MKFYGQALQDKFVCEILKYKKNGYFLEIGSFEQISINNTYTLETNLNCTGIMMEKQDFSEKYKKQRPNSKYVIGDATKTNFTKLFLEKALLLPEPDKK